MRVVAQALLIWVIKRFEDHSISLSSRRLMWNIPKTCDQTIFFVPDLRLFHRQVEQDSDEARRSEIEGRETIEQANKEKSLFGMNEGESQLFGLPIDLLKIIVRLLNPVDYINLRSISKTCRSVLPQIQWREPSISLPFAPLSPWLVFSYMDSGIHSFMDPKLGGRYLINIPKSLVDGKILHSKDGWLLMSKTLKGLSFYNPLTKEIIKLSKLDMDFLSYSCIGFSSSPKSPECLVVAIDSLHFPCVYTIHPGEEKWHYYEFENHNYRSDTSLDSPVFYDGAIYVLDEYGNLVVFELQREGKMTWKVLHVHKRPIEFDYQNFLLVCAGKLLLVLISKVGKGAMVFKLNRAKMCWRRVRKLENYALYVSRSSSFSTLVKGNGMGNRIFLPRVHGNSVVNYYLKTRKFHCFSRQDDNVVKYSDTRNLLQASWIQPSW
ncbi:F-box/kelch-repeat protein At1g57790-like isoform X2 [Tripterygium wilfordii]|uniref:F-box/kelch-repeat protein At1g57790-like isoform X2 n=1 Tax=Tripterygium wilfordii TaxID=458696 RepID=UPI0018F81FBB|nr:F-box/kelch-repeat protein At1g57790-like isoform X2 [Tripterygium wilfordii]